MISISVIQDWGQTEPSRWEKFYWDQEAFEGKNTNKPDVK